MTDEIRSFGGYYGFLSNFYASPIRWAGMDFPTAEHLYQARKTSDANWRQRIAACPTPREAKALGREVPLVSYWEEAKVQIMEEVLQIKFQNAQLAAMLIGTGNHLLIEGNSWHDQFWGDCHCGQHRSVQGRNALGILLMRLRLTMGVAR